MSVVRLIKDPVHGYISISREYCRLFVDTPIFQRLRLIEQTSMRCLFPGARHDRFIHSLGVYHLASRIYKSITENVQDHEIKALLEDTNLKNTFLVAALMHDCGHAPFSHTLEKFYNKNADGSLHNATAKKLKEIAPMEDAGALDFFTSSIRANPPANHEVMSAYVLLSRYSKAMGKVGVAPGLAARMITGAVYVEPELDAKRHKEKLGLWEKVANVLITLVNGTALDVDKLDYIIRDTWASGVKNTAIDMDRLVRSATIVRSVSRGEDHVCFAFKKSAISVVQSVIDARNYLYKWIYGHHTVLYYSHLLEHAVVNFAEKYAKEYHTTAKSVLQRMFSPEMFEREVFLAKKNGLKSYLLSDADILYFLKMVIPDDPDYVAYVSHKPHHIPLWKTALEYNNCLQSKRFSVTKMDAIRAKHHLSQDECFACEDMTAKIYDLKDEDVQIEMSSGSVVPITKLVALPKHPSLAEKQELSFCYVYLDVSRREDKEEIVKSINKLSAKR